MIIVLVSSLVLVSLVIMFGLGDEEPEVPDPQPDNNEEDETDYPEFAGRLFLNEEEIELDNVPLLAKGLVHLPLLELAEAVDADINQEDNVIFVGDPGDVDEDDAGGDLRIYTGSTDITPSNIIAQGDEYYIEAREAAPMLGLNIYDNLFANSVHLTDNTLASQDGDYVVVRRRDERGWAPEIRMSISGGAVTSVEYLELNEEGTNKLEDEEYLENWGNASEIDPVALVRQYEEQLIQTQSVAEVDVSTGATGSWKNFVQLAANALGKAQVGTLPQQYPDGNYVVVGNPSNQGWTPVLEFTVSEGEITTFSYDEQDEEGNSKREDEEYLGDWRAAFPEIDPIAIVAEREENILRTQDPNLIDATTGATSWGVSIKEYATGALDHAALAQLPQEYDTVYVFVGPETDRGDLPQLLLATVDDEIVFVDFSDYRNGIAKKFDQDYLNNWQDQYPNVDPVAIVQELQDTFLENEDPGDLDAISGATSWRTSFQELAERALEFIGE